MSKYIKVEDFHISGLETNVRIDWKLGITDPRTVESRNMYINQLSASWWDFLNNFNTIFGRKLDLTHYGGYFKKGQFFVHIKRNLMENCVWFGWIYTVNLTQQLTGVICDGNALLMKYKMYFYPKVLKFCSCEFALCEMYNQKWL